MARTFRTRLLASSLLISSIAFATPAIAQDEAAPAAQEEEGELVITGTLIQRPDLEVSSPLTVIGAEEIEFKQPNTAEDLLRDLPAVRPALGPAVNNGGDGSSQVDLRGLNWAGSNNSQRTLVLQDGRRLVPFGLNGFTDLNNIPLALVERVDVVTGGASTVYGADAVAGVVNFITKRDFTGIDISSNYRISEEGDGAQYRGDVTIGASFDDDRGNVVMSFGYMNRKPVFSTNRFVGRFPLGTSSGEFSGATAAVPTIIQGTPSNAALGLPASDQGAAFDPALGAFRAATPNDTYNTNNFQYIQAPLERFNGYAAGRYEITPGIEAYGSAMFTKNIARIQLASTGTFSNTFFIPLSNAYLPAAARTQLCNAYDTNPAVAGIQPLTPAQCAAAATATSTTDPNYREIAALPGRRTVEAGARGNPVESTVFQIQGGLRGDLFAGLKYDLFAAYGQTDQTQIRENWGSATRLQQAIRSYRNAAGNPVCYDTSNGCVPINLFGPQGSITPEQLAFWDLDAIITRTVRQSVISGNIGGDLFGLKSPFADSNVAFSIGAEQRVLSARAQPDAPTQIQGEVLGTGARTPPDVGRIKTQEVFGEINIPLVKDVPFFHSLTVEGGIRYSDYSTTGGSTTWKAGGSWEPIEDLKLRGMYQVAVRSPNIQELFQSPVIGLNNLTTDPCQASQLPNGTGANAARAALCVATGAPAGSIGSIPQPTSGQINATTAGNPNLDVERAKTWTLGAVFQPSFIPRLAVTLDYYNIVVEDAVSNPSAADILNGCYTTALNPSQTPNAFCSLIIRNPLNGSLNGAGETPGVILAGSNLGTIETAGIDLGITYQLPLGGDDTLRFSANGTWLDYYHFQATPNAINRDCTGYYSTNCLNPRPEWKWLARVTYSTGPFDISLNWSHLSAVKIEPFQAAATQPLTTPQTGGPNPVCTTRNSLGQCTNGVFDAYENIPAYDYFDLSVATEVTENFSMVLSVDNLFNKAPPIVGATTGGTAFNNANTFPTMYDAVGRAYTVSARLKF